MDSKSIVRKDMRVRIPLRALRLWTDEFVQETDLAFLEMARFHWFAGRQAMPPAAQAPEKTVRLSGEQLLNWYRP